MQAFRRSPLESALATVRGGARMVEAAAEDAVAAFDVLGVTGARGQPSDPFDARDPDYIRATVPAKAVYNARQPLRLLGLKPPLCGII